MLLNFNPYTALSEPGQDLAAEALALVQGCGDGSGGHDDNMVQDSGNGELDNNDIWDSPPLNDQMVGGAKLSDVIVSSLCHPLCSDLTSTLLRLLALMLLINLTHSLTTPSAAPLLLDSLNSRLYSKRVGT